MYEKYDLFDDPFKLENDHEVVGRSQNQTFDRILEFLSNNSAFERRTGNRFIAALKGEYGAGKSFFQIKLTESIETRNTRFKKYVGENVKIAVSRFPMLDENKRLPTNINLHLYHRIVSNLGSNGEQFFFQLYENLENMARHDGVEISRLVEDLSPQFVRALTCMTPDSPNEHVAWKWISAQKLTKKEMELLGVGYYINAPDLAEKQIFELLKLLKITGFGLLLVCIDEVEEISTVVNDRQYFRAMGVLKEIFDKYEEPKYSSLKPITPIGFLCSMTGDAWDKLRRAAEENEFGMMAVVTRIGEATFEFERFNDEDAEQFIKVLIAKKRIEDSKKDPLYPFDKESARMINGAAYGNPREITNKCKKLLAEAIKQKISKIDSRFTSRYLSDIGAGTVELREGEEQVEAEQI